MSALLPEGVRSLPSAQVRVVSCPNSIVIALYDGIGSEEVLQQLAEHGVRVLPLGEWFTRFIIHRERSSGYVDRALVALAGIRQRAAW